MQAFIEASDDQLVPVQNVFRRSRSSLTARLNPLSLPGNSQRLNKERREKGPRPNAKTRDGDDWHKFLLPPEYLTAV